MTIPGLAIYTGTRSLAVDPDVDPVLPQLVSVQWSHALDEADEAWPRREAITTATVVILMADAAEAAYIGPDSLVYLELLTEAGGDPVDSFSGRASYPTIKPHDDGVMVTITVTDYLLDLTAFAVGGADMPAETAGVRINSLMGGSLLVPLAPWSAPLAARPKNTTTLLAMMQEIVHGVMADANIHPTLVTWAGYELRPRLDGGYLHPLNPWHLVQLDKEPNPVPPPLKLREHPDAPGTIELWADPDDPDTAAAVIDASCTTFEAEWAKRYNLTVNTVHVKLADGSHVTATNNATLTQAPIAYTRETQLTDPADAQELAEFLLPAAKLTEPSSWQADAFTVLLDETPDGWYPLPLRSPMALGGIQRRHHPEELTYFTGVVTSLELSVAAGTATVTVRLEGQPVGESDPATMLTVDDLPGNVEDYDPTVTLDALNWAHTP